MISWKHAFRRLNEEFETAKKKKRALDSLLDAGRISQSTHDLFNREIAETITDVERQQKALLQKMNAKMMELADQIKTMEILLANFEIQHVTGEVDDETYQREMNVLSMGLEASKQELETIKEAADQLSSGNIAIEQETAQHQEEKLPKPVVGFAEVAEASASESPKEISKSQKESKPTGSYTENEEKQEA